MTKLISKETIHRLLKDIKQLMREPLHEHGIFYYHDESDVLKGYAMIVGPEDTPYFGGFYLFNFEFPNNYPFSPPKVTFMTNNGLTRFNPNFYKSGKVCVSILNTWSGDKWSSCQTINSILLTLCSLLNNEPLLNEPGQNIWSNDFIPYQKSIQFTNIDFAICDILHINQNILNNSQTSSVFLTDMKTQFIKNYDKILLCINNHISINENVKVNIFAMNTDINYSKLKTKFENIKKQIDADTDADTVTDTDKDINIDKLN